MGGPAACAATRSADELVAQYSCLFPSGNRNAASHVWVGHIMRHAASMTHAEFDEQARAFCAVSGSPVQGGDAFVQDLPTTSDGTARVAVRHCCWPCACDTLDASRARRLHVHAGVVATGEGDRPVHHLVIDDPCEASARARPEAPEVRCRGGVLQDAWRVQTPQGEKVAIGFAFPTSAEPNVPTARCAARAADGYQSGMGSIFRDLLSL